MKNDNPKYLVRICVGRHCQDSFADDIFKITKKIIDNKDDIEVEKRTCMCMCSMGPNLEIVNQETGEKTSHHKVTFNDIEGIINNIN